MKGTKVERRKIQKMNQIRLQYIYIYMEMSQGNLLCSYLKQAKMSFLFSFIIFKNRRVDPVLPGGLVTVGAGRRWEKGIGG
jgi:hypothetical protein